MKNFRSFLQEKCRIPGKKVTFYMYWISKYNTFSKGRTPGDTDLVKSFLKVLSQKHEEWQVKQAEKAISLYFFFTAGELSGNTDKDLQFLPKIPSDWKSVKEDTVRLLRLRHRSYRTEKTYLGWLRRFSDYLNYKSSKDVT